ncbi:hypothetical protein FRB99_004180, partial [Tulasnella sp. 403]
VYQIIQRHLDAHPEDASRYPNFKSATGHRPIYAKGATGPIKGQMNLAEYFHGPDGLSDISTSHPEYNVDPSLWGNDNPYLDISSKPGHQVILDILEREPEGTVTILSCGPLTNISLAISQSPKTFSRVKRLVSMGATLDVPGNTSATSEFNFFADPYAAQHVLDEARNKLFKLVLVPLDITSRHTILFDWIIPSDVAAKRDTLESHGANSAPTPVEGFISNLLRRPRVVLKQLGLPDHFEMHDPLAAWYTIRTSGDTVEQGWGTVKRRFVIEKIGEYTKGMCVVDRRGTTEEVGATRAIEGIVVEQHAAASSTEDDPHAVDVLLKWPDTRTFVEQMMKRVFWYSPAVSDAERR